MKNQRSTNDAKTDLRLNCAEVLKRKMFSPKSEDIETLLKFVDQDNPLLRIDCVDLATRRMSDIVTAEGIIEEAEMIYKFVIAKEDCKDHNDKNMIDPQQLDLAYEYFKQTFTVTNKLNEKTKRRLRHMGMVIPLCEIRCVLSMIQHDEFYGYIRRHREYNAFKFLDLPEDNQDPDNAEPIYDRSNVKTMTLKRIKSNLPKGYQQILWRQLNNCLLKDIKKVLNGKMKNDEILDAAIRMAKKYQSLLNPPKILPGIK